MRLFHVLCSAGTAALCIFVIYFFCEGGTLYVRPMLLCCIIPSDIVEVELTESVFHHQTLSHLKMISKDFPSPSSYN